MMAWVLLGFSVLLPMGSAASDTNSATEPSAESDDQAADGEQRARRAGNSLIGQAGPDVAFTTLDGERIDLAGLYGEKPVYLKFWATWCIPCRKQMPGFQQMFEAYGDRIQIVAVNTGFSDTATAARAYREKLGLTMPMTVDDGTLWKALNLRVTPQHVLIDRSGHIAYVGHRDDAELHQALARILNADEPGQPTVQPAKVATTDALVAGDHVGHLKAKTLGGNTVDLGGAGKPLGLVFFSPWCESYLAESQPETSKACERVRQTVDRLAGRDDAIEWIGVSSGLWATEADLEAYKADTGVTIPLALDASGEIYRAFGVRQIPSVVLIDRAGRVARALGPQDRALEQSAQSVVTE